MCIYKACSFFVLFGYIYIYIYIYFFFFEKQTHTPQEKKDRKKVLTQRHTKKSTHKS